MIRLFAVCAVLLLLTGCEDPPPQQPCYGPYCPAYEPEIVSSYSEIPIVNPPFEARQQNWVKYGSGSCYHAAIITNMIFQGLEEYAAWWRQTYGSGESTRGLCQKLDLAGLRFAVCANGDERFLEWAVRTRRGAAIPYFPNHAVNIKHLDAEWAVLLDNNRTGEYIWIRRSEFLHNWRNRYGGCAVTVVYSPAPPPLHL